jgi:hypothetical protein
VSKKRVQEENAQEGRRWKVGSTNRDPSGWVGESTLNRKKISAPVGWAGKERRRRREAKGRSSGRPDYMGKKKTGEKHLERE